MLVLALTNAAIPLPLASLRTKARNGKTVKARDLCCLGTNGEIKGLIRTIPEMSCRSRLESHDNAEMSQGGLQPYNVEPEAKQDDIWQLFREAQQNILHLNKLRLVALEELNKSNKEKQLLLDRINQLEAEKQREAGEDKLLLFWELLLRIDSMVLTGLINTGEASDLRNLVMDHKTCLADVFPDIRQKKDSEILAQLHYFSDGSNRNGLHIVHICTEMAPLVSVGPLASYVTGLSRALLRKGHLVEVILPKYGILELDEIQGLREIEAEAYSYYNGQLHGNRIWTGVICGIGVTLIQSLDYASFFSREKVYGYSDDFERFTYFSRASLDYIVKSGKRPDVLHIHDWQTAIIGPLFWDIFVKQGLEGTRILLTCQGFDSQCLVQPDKLALCGLDPSRLHRPDRLQDNAKTHHVNILKGGVVYSNKVVILTSMHSKRRFISSLGYGLEPTLAIHREKLLISPLGFDHLTWDPSKDKFLPENYSAEDMKGKSVCKVALQQQLGLAEQASTIIVGVIFLEVSDVDLENLKAIVQNTTRRGVQFVFMGTSKMPNINRALESIQGVLEGRNTKFIRCYDEALLHLIFAGSDIILCRSFHDPIFQVPLKALKYGAAPVVVAPNDDDAFRHSVDHDKETTRFWQFIISTFGNMSLEQALDEIKSNPSSWKQKIMDAMTEDFSWGAECSDIHISAYTDIKNL